jgi:hypothetical protein
MLKRSVDPCPGCCLLTEFDEKPAQRSPELDVDAYLDSARNEADKHSCRSTFATRPRQTASVSFNFVWADYYIAAFQLFSCHVEGFGVEADVDKGLACLVSFAERGMSVIQHILVSLFILFNRPTPQHLPLRKWLIESVVLGDAGDAMLLLANIDPQLLEIAKDARYILCDGMNIFSNLDRLELSPIEIEAGYTKLHKAAGSPAQDLDHIEQRCGTSIGSGDSDIYHVDRLGLDKETPLLVACRAQRLATIDLLLQLGANVSIPSQALGETPLHRVVLMDESEDLINELLARGADINAQSKKSLLREPWLLGSLKSAQCALMTHGTPLYSAVALGNEEATRSLVNHRADTQLTPPGALTPLELAVSMVCKSLVEILFSSVPHDYTISPSELYALVRDNTVTNRCWYLYLEED